MGKSKFTFFKNANPSSIAQLIENITNNKPLIQELIQRITIFKNSFDEELRQSHRNREEILAAFNRSKCCLDTLKKMDANQPITAEEQRVLFDYIKPMHLSGAQIIEEIPKDKTDVEEIAKDSPEEKSAMP
ncbi:MULTISPECIES: hypothetical protein [Legionella]|uniref:Uncharacterized protein n=1 Tax=Legionella maceachernii TaxID=466 RepID=A0A0W0W3I5_9GAMM|nr:hypothetical protein [Legionella maceachernii]KTD27008.1 hypothetical protein Lmac_1256 [Legionella maceachernii]SKA03068.1 hypothetical protein SAMN02745128_01814 [Legionella maceachernii]SUP00148.1 Uncharacterised protein [Legionella maceachernii]